MPRLGVNIDHVATVRQARGECYPRVSQAAAVALENGADQITIHLREDRRHIQDHDVYEVKKITSDMKKLLNLEMGCSQDILNIALDVGPEWVCLVPENRQERTTEGGLSLTSPEIFSKVEFVMKALKKKHKNLKVSLFLEATPPILEQAIKLAPDAVEIHTGAYAKEFLERRPYGQFIEDFHIAAKMLEAQKIACHAGHGLTKMSTIPLLQEKLFTEYNIGHWIISDAIFYGLGNIVKDLKNTFNEYEGA